jgi:uncharacterized damage-inducible protein DinB
LLLSGEAERETAAEKYPSSCPSTPAPRHSAALIDALLDRPLPLGRKILGMVDHKPPRSSGDEREVLMTLLHYQRESLMRKVFGVDDAAARQSPVASGTTLLWLVRHLAYAERLWIIHRFAGGEEPPPVCDTSCDTVDAALTAYRRTWADVDAIIAAAPTFDEVSVIADDSGHLALRWILAHLLEETARHAGHADILRELIDGVTGR